MNICIKNGRVIDPANDRDGVQNVYIGDGKIQGIGRSPNGFVAKLTIDATDKLVMPGFIDLNASLREPGYEQKPALKVKQGRR